MSEIICISREENYETVYFKRVKKDLERLLY